jgi:hypothetical protein
MPGEFANRLKQQVRLRGANPFGCGERPEHSDGSHSGSPRHLDVFRRIAHVHTLFRLRAEKPERHLKRRRMRFLARRVFAVYTRGEVFRELEFAELLPDAPAASAGHKPQTKLSNERVHHRSRAGQQGRAFRAVRRSPKPVGSRPIRTRNPRSSIDPIPIGRIVPVDLGRPPVDSDAAKHGEVGTLIGRVGIEQGAVPVQQDETRMEWRSIQGGGIVPEEFAVWGCAL